MALECLRNQTTSASAWHGKKKTFESQNNEDVVYESPPSRLELQDWNHLPEMEDVAPDRKTTNFKASPKDSTASTAPLSQRSRPVSRNELPFNSKMTRAETEQWRKSLGTRVAALAKLQDRIISLQVQSQGKRTALRHLRENLAQQHSLIWNHLQEHENDRHSWASQDLNILHNAIQTTRGELTPAELDLVNLEEKLLGEEHLLAEREHRLKMRLHVLEDGATAGSTDLMYSEYDSCLDGDGASSKISYENSLASGPPQATVTVDSDHSLERYIGQTDTPWNLLHSPSNHRLRTRPSEADIDALLDTIHTRRTSQDSLPRAAEELEPLVLWNQYSLNQDAPDLRAINDDALASEASELYVEL